MDAGEGRPEIWVGHVGPIKVANLPAAVDFYGRLGLRIVVDQPEMAAMQLRGGTHLVLLAGQPESIDEAPFDLMVEDLEATQARFRSAGVEVSDIVELRNHRRIDVSDPDGRRVSVYDSHVVGPA
ncbi:MAG: VOC family protein [Actinomycetota bacterium]